MAALSGEKTLAELSAEFGVHPTMISNWKQELVKRAGELFARGSKAPAVEDAQKVIDDLHRKIGQLQVECDFLIGCRQDLGQQQHDRPRCAQTESGRAHQSGDALAPVLLASCLERGLHPRRTIRLA